LDSTVRGIAANLVTTVTLRASGVETVLHGVGHRGAGEGQNDNKANEFGCFHYSFFYYYFDDCN
jgi:hypothetical protein